MADEIQKIFQERKVKGIIQKLNTANPEKLIDQLVEVGPEACNYLISALRNKDLKIRKNSAIALGRIKDKKAIEPLIRVLTEDANEEVQKGAETGLVELGYNSMKSLIKLLEEDELDNEKKKRVAGALDHMELHNLTKNNQAVYHLAKGNFAECARIGAPAVPYLIKCLNKGDDNLKEKAETTLLRIGIPALPDLINTLASMDDTLRGCVLAILDKMDVNTFHTSEKASYFLAKGNLDDCLELKNAAVNPLIRALEDPRRDVVRNAIEGLKRLGSISVDELIKELKGRKRKTKGEIAKILGELGDKKAVEVLISCLSDIEPDVRISAAQSLCKIGDERAVPFLINKALLDKDKRVRILTGDILKKMGKVVGPPLIKILEDPKSSEELRETSVKVLGEIQAEIAVDILTKIMLEGKGKLRELSAKALGEIGSKKATEALISVLDDARELSGWQRGYNATVALGKIRDARAVPNLIKILNDEGYLPQLQGAAADSLGKIGDKSVVDELINALENKKIQREVIVSIGTLGNPKGTEHLLKIFRAEESSTPLKALVMESIGNLGDYSASEDIIKSLRKEQLRIPGLIALGKMREEKAIPHIEEILFDSTSNEEVKSTCIDTLIKIQKKESITSMIKVLKNRNIEATLKRLLIESFPKMGEVIIKPFVEELRKDQENEELNKSLIKILGNLKSNRVVPDLLKLISEIKSDVMKGEIIIAFGNIKDNSSVKLLMEILNNKDNSPFCRKASIAALINIGDSKAINSLIKTTEDENEEVRNYSLKILKQIGIPIVSES
ncbi:MAG: HEAT repeat domain-containing protein [Candidatus Eremiobacterota bacterium]